MKSYKFASSYIMITLRKIGLYLLFLSALVLILNSVLPHHHHHEDVCFVADHCENDETDDHDSHHEQNGAEHEHHENDSDFCQLNSLFLSQSYNGISAKVKLTNSEKDISGLNKLRAINLSFVSISSFFNRVHYNKLYQLNPQNLTRALRAPPSC